MGHLTVTKNLAVKRDVRQVPHINHNAAGSGVAVDLMFNSTLKMH